MIDKIPYTKVIGEEKTDDYLSKNGHWVGVSITQGIGWPTKKCMIQYKNQSLALLPDENDQYPAVVSIIEKGITEEKLRQLILEFISVLSWCHGNYIKIESWIGGSRPFRHGKSSPIRVISPHFEITYLPEIENDKAKLALALFREAQCLSNIAYSFLSYYKIINLRYPKRADKQKKWIKRNLIKIKDRQSLDRIEELENLNEDITDYLYISCRCAIAHAGTNVTINPDDFNDNQRLYKDVSIIKALAELMIEYEFGVKTTHTIWQEHLYELNGFKVLFGNKLVEKLANGISEFKKKIPLPKSISIRLQGKQQYTPLEDMTVETISAADGFVVWKCVSKDQLIDFILGLNFIDDTLDIDPVNGIGFHDDGSPNAAEQATELFRFKRDHVLNGRLEIWSTFNNECLGRCDPFIPTNIDMGATVKNFDNSIYMCKKAAKQRQD